MRVAAGILSLLLALPAAAGPPGHDRAFWLGLATKDFAVPEGESAGALALEAADLLSSPTRRSATGSATRRSHGGSTRTASFPRPTSSAYASGSRPA